MQAVHDHQTEYKRSLKKLKHVTSHVFVEKTHVVAVPLSFARMVLALTWLYILSFTEINLGVLESWGGVENRLLHWFG